MILQASLYFIYIHAPVLSEGGLKAGCKATASYRPIFKRGNFSSDSCSDFNNYRDKWSLTCKWIWKRKKIIIFKINLVSFVQVTIWRKKELVAENQASIRKSSNHIIKRYGPSFQRVTKRSLVVLRRNGADIKEVALASDTSSRTSVLSNNSYIWVGSSTLSLMVNQDVEQHGK